MQRKTLAKIDAKRQITHEGGHTVHIMWDEQLFNIPRTEFNELVRVLKAGQHADYADCGEYSVVRVDDNSFELWLDDTCMTLTSNEYRILTNAVLTTETRLHGFRTTSERPSRQKYQLTPIAVIRPPRPVRRYEN